MSREKETVIVNKDYVTPQLIGRLGNNMFIAAAAYAYALEHNKQLVIYDGRHYEYSRNIFRKFDFLNRRSDWGNEGEVARNPGDNPPNDKPIVISGYNQNIKLFEKYSEPLKSMFCPPDEFINKVREKIPAIFENRTTVVHVRRGDYLGYKQIHPTVTPEYVSRALSKIPAKANQVLIVSDDVAWCKENIDGASDALYIEEWETHEQLWIMSLCHDFVLSNSTFGWWGAYLSRQPDKTVIAPSTWFGPNGPPRFEAYDRDWIILPTYFDGGLIRPEEGQSTT